MEWPRGLGVNALFIGLKLACDRKLQGLTMSETLNRQHAHEPDLVRCEICWGWIDRNDARSQFEHRGCSLIPVN